MSRLRIMIWSNTKSTKVKNNNTTNLLNYGQVLDNLKKKRNKRKKRKKKKKMMMMMMTMTAFN